ncbi:aspartate aminotransferase family protein [Vibrio metoecus]|uniref:Cytochrome D ubiquinol oxidase subunit II n=1 Tax=Vibrio metoecus TaxID=1481663 RepID=A0A0N8VAJ8_VIBMT|nr:aspartate aminotransferase family protein [Vibrio metoecus]KQB01395.1 cytochrome D ubiquinol oxidase subunit II [Vibrio metoecus]PAR38431.1 aspartate aminotransferase family protein [Vibrio metoecus]
MSHALSDRWLALQANQLHPRFEQHYCAVKAKFFSRDPELWPLYRSLEIQPLLHSRRETPAVNHHLLKLLTTRDEVPRFSRYQGKPFDDVALYAAQHSKNWDDPRSVENVISTPCDPAIHGGLLAMIANPNLVYGEYAGMAAELEKLVVRQIASLVGYSTEQATGIFTQGGTFCNLYGYLLGLRKVIPETISKGIATRAFKMLNSEAGHYSNMTNLALLGVDVQSQVIRVRVTDNNEMDLNDLHRQLSQCFEQQQLVPTIMLTFGTTDTFALDDVKAVYDLRESLCHQYAVSRRPHIHVDAAVGWPLLFFTSYDVQRNPLAINPATLAALTEWLPKIRALQWADSFTVDFQKWGYVPYTSSLVMVKNSHDMQSLKSDPSYFSYFESTRQQETHLQATIECSRSAVGVFAAYSALQMMGIEGYQVILAHGLQNASYLRAQLATLPHCKLIAEQNHGPSVAFRLYPPNVKSAREAFVLEMDLSQHPDYVEKLVTHTLYHRHHFLERKGKSLNSNWVESLTRTHYDRDGRCLHLPGEKVVLMNPHTTRTHLDAFMNDISRR